MSYSESDGPIRSVADLISPNTKIKVGDSVLYNIHNSGAVEADYDNDDSDRGSFHGAGDHGLNSLMSSELDPLHQRYLNREEDDDDGVLFNGGYSGPGSGVKYNKKRRTKNENFETSSLISSVHEDQNKSSFSSNIKKNAMTLEEITQANQIKRRKMANVFMGDSDGCFGCKYGLLVKYNEENDYNAPDYTDVITKIIKQATFKIKTDELLKSIKNVYEKEIRPYYKEIDKDPGDWDIESIREHFFEHVRDPALNARKMIDRLNSICDILYDNLMYEDPNNAGCYVANEKNLKSINILTEQIRRMYQIDPRKSLAYDKQMTVTSDNIGSVFLNKNLNHNISKN